MGKVIDKLSMERSKKSERELMVGKEKWNQKGRQKKKKEYVEEAKEIEMKPNEEEMETMKMGEKIYRCHFLDI